MDQSLVKLGKMPCPVCSEQIDFTTEQGQQDALTHMQKDDTHRSRMARVKTNQVRRVS